ncbi:hypothetical protein HDU86_001325 [Geranomyces michiganensis]|nr:hypothetical protein HDU86_001325 [Geranomyces michiganensis]
MSTSSTARKPVFAIIGTTGVGKSQLGVELAQAVGGEVINADSMQVYKGLDIATNKAPLHEWRGVPHHLMDFVHPSKEYSVADFERDALRTISEIHARGRIPILVGGTNYYVQSILFKNRIIATAKADEHLKSSNENDVVNDDDADASLPLTAAAADVPSPALAGHPLASGIGDALRATDPRTASREEIDRWSRGGSRLLDLLAQVDPIMADRWHVRDVRKIRRSLQIFYTTGRRHSDIMSEQRQLGSSDSNSNAPVAGAAAGQLRFDNTCVFWLHADPKALYPRLDARVGDMINLGLFDELHAMRAIVRSGGAVGARTAAISSPATSLPVNDDDDDNAAASCPPTNATTTATSSGPQSVDYTRGILQAIGFKEFEGYLSAREKAHAATAITVTSSTTPVDTAAAAAAAKEQETLETLKTRGLEDMKRATRQYARRQVAWIKNKLAVACLGEVDAAAAGATRVRGTEAQRIGFYLLDATSLDDWSSNIAERAVSLAKDFLAASNPLPNPRTLNAASAAILPPPASSSANNHSPSSPPRRWTKRTCPVCVDVATGEPRVLNGAREWEVHIATRGHRRREERAKEGPKWWEKTKTQSKQGAEPQAGEHSPL